MAARQALSGKMKLILTYQNEDGVTKERQVNLANLKAGMDAADVSAVATALGTLQEDPIKEVREIIESIITA